MSLWQHWHTGNNGERTFDIRATESTVSATKSTILVTKSTELATMSTATSCRILGVADLLPKLATKSTVSATEMTASVTVDFAADLSRVSATVDFVASVYPALVSTLKI